jgi:hypothetical protein
MSVAVQVPAAAVVPVMRTALLIAKPGGSPLADHDDAELLAAAGKLDAVFTMPLVLVALMMTGAYFSSLMRRLRKR